MLPIARQLLPNVLQLTKNPLKLPGVGGKRFLENCEKNIFRYNIFGEKFLINFAYLAAPHRAAAAPKCAPTR